MKLKGFIGIDKRVRLLFGKKELEIILKQLEGIELSQSEKNRLSRDIKPKFEVIKELNKFSKEFSLKKNQNNKILIKKAVDIIMKENPINPTNPIKAILLFGSFADNTFTKKSDIDICVIFKNKISLKEATKFRMKISGELSDKVDVQVFNVLPQKVKKSIAGNHKVLFSSKGYDNLDFSIRYLKDNDFFLRINKIFGVEA